MIIRCAIDFFDSAKSILVGFEMEYELTHGHLIWLYFDILKINWCSSHHKINANRFEDSFLSIYWIKLNSLSLTFSLVLVHPLLSSFLTIHPIVTGYLKCIKEFNGPYFKPTPIPPSLHRAVLWGIIILFPHIISILSTSFLLALYFHLWTHSPYPYNQSKFSVKYGQEWSLRKTVALVCVALAFYFTIFR